jgi:hypothetical protein
MRCSVLIAAVLGAATFCFGADASTVAWWHFNEGDVGQRTTNGEVATLNAVDPSKHALKAGVLSGNNAYVEGYDQYLPSYANAFPDYATWSVPGGIKGSDNRGMYFNPQNSDGTGYGSVLYTEVTDELKLPSLTVELFIKADYVNSANHWKNLIVMGGDGNLDAWGLRVNNNGTLHFRHKNAGVDNEALSLTGVNALDGEWHHVAFTFDGDTKKVTLYFDYTKNSSATCKYGLEYVEDLRYLEIGSFNKADYGRWRGWVDEVRISNKVLSPSEFLQVEKSAQVSVCEELSEPDTVVYMPFDTEMTKDKLFLSFINAAGGTTVYPATLAVDSNGAYPQLMTDNLPHDHLHSGVLATDFCANSGYWNFVTNALGKSAMIDVDDVRALEDGTLIHDFTSHSCTIEMFVRPETSYAHNIYLACQHAAGGAGSLMWQLTQNRHVKLEALGVGETARRTINSSYLTGGKWHHIALVFDREAKTAEIFIDYEAAGRLDDFLLVSSVDDSRYSRYLQLFGGYGHSHNMQMQGGVDDVRLTRRALKSYEFLRKGTAEPVGRTRAWFSFDGDYTVKPRPNDIPAGTVTSDETGFSTRVPQAVIVDGEENVLSETNRASAVLSKTVKFARNMFADSVDMRSQTLEFFLFLESLPTSDYATVFRFNDAQSGDVVYSVRINKGQFDMRIDTVSEKEKEDVKDHFNQGKTFGAGGVALSDGRWHHVAFTFEPDYDSNKTLLKMYLDYKYIGSNTANGILRTVGGGELASTSFTIGSTALNGFIDEVRLSQGVLEVKDMLRATRVKLPFAIIIR